MKSKVLQDKEWKIEENIYRETRNRKRARETKKKVYIKWNERKEQELKSKTNEKKPISTRESSLHLRLHKSSSPKLPALKSLQPLTHRNMQNLFSLYTQFFLLCNPSLWVLKVIFWLSGSWKCKRSNPSPVAD